MHHISFNSFLQVICDEHGISPNGIYEGENDIQAERLNVYFNEGSGISII